MNERSVDGSKVCTYLAQICPNQATFSEALPKGATTPVAPQRHKISKQGRQESNSTPSAEPASVGNTRNRAALTLVARPIRHAGFPHNRLHIAYTANVRPADKRN